ncbi:hypothetical protein EIP86_002054 [Pleurotus ostreatoroseus]|nr:hypothetical protein EIP86_002054 [Pleurotus ostreatoroseus]
MSNPRPILKHRKISAAEQILPFATCSALRSPHVHFPPTPALVAATHPVYSPRTYDRRPILQSPSTGVVSNATEFEVERPERGRPREKPRDSDVIGSYFHPRAFEACEPEDVLDSDPFLTPPLLIRDESPVSPSEEEVITPPDPHLGSTITFLEALPTSEATESISIKRVRSITPVLNPPLEIVQSIKHSHAHYQWDGAGAAGETDDSSVRV